MAYESQAFTADKLRACLAGNSSFFKRESIFIQKLSVTNIELMAVVAWFEQKWRLLLSVRL